MSGRIPRDFIDDMIARSDIVDIIDARVRLKKAGRNHQACCPFHNEKTPSFTVSQDKQFYHCFGCGAHGNVLSFLMEYDHLEFPEAVEELARYHGMDVPREASGKAPDPRKRQQTEDDYALMDKAARFFAHQLKHHAQGEKAVDYLKQRGLSGDVVKAFGIGYAPPEWDALLSTFAVDNARRQQLQDLKLITTSDKGNTFDFFRDRIQFPIRDRRGRVIGFGGRVLGDGTPKYLNSPETRIFHKGNELYGFYQAKQAHRKLERVLIVEGYMDVVALAQFGVDYAVASLGTATTSEQIQLLFRHCPQIICCYDGDRAGREAAWRTLENALPLLKDGYEMRFLFLPDGEDPDTLVRQIGKDAFEAKLDEALPLSQFLFDNLLQQHKITSAEGKAALRTQAQPLIGNVAGEQLKLLLQQRLDKLSGSANQRQQAAQASTKENRNAEFHKPSKFKISPVRMLLCMLLEQPALAGQFVQIDPTILNRDQIAGLDLLQEVHQLCVANPNLSSAQLLEYFRGRNEAQQLAKLMSWEHHVKPERIAQVYQDSFAKLIEWHIQGRMEQLLSQSQIGPLSDAEKQELKLLMAAKKA